MLHRQPTLVARAANGPQPTFMIGAVAAGQLPQSRHFNSPQHVLSFYVCNPKKDNFCAGRKQIALGSVEDIRVSLYPEATSLKTSSCTIEVGRQPLLTLRAFSPTRRSFLRSQRALKYCRFCHLRQQRRPQSSASHGVTSSRKQSQAEWHWRHDTRKETENSHLHSTAGPHQN
ncbi:hypothetical protein DFP92_111152 [Yoonia sediminilitoris]|uniref:Uncharacterized protein n=1 Tax=Yoonia sediminilitoris TaxID=1286148 RepID=A0A2T6KBB8_9RHOB|nr:hypothetical protein C8N45_111153 [Yoonia sediminilitoris]RCW93003.1 hypothetical protein DFP92_111152 [Yoonia sediminilitoris]